MQNSFLPADIVLPKDADVQKWAVIACDQFTSDIAYWNRVRDYVGDSPSALHMILPEAELETKTEDTINRINDTMLQYLHDDVFVHYPQCFIYVERTLVDGSIRKGIVGAVDLEEYDYHPYSKAKIRATEQTVLERIPPRVEIRKGAAIELSHIIVFCDDTRFSLIEPIAEKLMHLKKLYDFDLMENGGHISGWLIDEKTSAELKESIHQYEALNPGEARYLVADGNHSLATAKHCYEACKQNDPAKDYPCRYAMIELENIHSPAICFEPIHRIMTQIDPDRLLKDMETVCEPNGCPITWVSGDRRGVVHLALHKNELPIAAMQRFLDKWMDVNGGVIDYIHDDDALVSLASNEQTVGFLMPGMNKSELFTYVAAGNILPRKTFSLGHAVEKRYYLEGRLIK